MDVQGKICLVTGAGSGIGRELALQLCQAGATVIGVDYNAETLTETQAQIQAAGGAVSYTHLTLPTNREV